MLGFTYTIKTDCTGKKTIVTPASNVYNYWKIFNTNLYQPSTWAVVNNRLTVTSNQSTLSARYNENNIELTDYKFTTDIQPGNSTGIVGVIFRFQDRYNYYYLAWDGGSFYNDTNTAKRLYRVKNGVTTLLASAPGTWVSNTLYTIETEVSGPHISISINGHIVFSLNDHDEIKNGSFGIAVAAAKGTSFGNVVLETIEEFTVTSTFVDGSVNETACVSPETAAQLKDKSVYDLVINNVRQKAAEVKINPDTVICNEFTVSTAAKRVRLFFSLSGSSVTRDHSDTIMAYAVPQDSIIPVSMYGVGIGSSAIKWVWNVANTLNLTEVKLYDLDGLIIAENLTGNSFVEEGLQPETEYTRVLKGTTADGKTIFSNIAIARTTAVAEESSTGNVTKVEEPEIVADEIEAFQSGVGDNLDLMVVKPDPNDVEEKFTYKAYLKGTYDKEVEVYKPIEFQYRFKATGKKTINTDNGKIEWKLTGYPKTVYDFEVNGRAEDPDKFDLTISAPVTFTIQKPRYDIGTWRTGVKVKYTFQDMLFNTQAEFNANWRAFGCYQIDNTPVSWTYNETTKILQNNDNSSSYSGYINVGLIDNGNHMEYMGDYRFECEVMVPGTNDDQTDDDAFAIIFRSDVYNDNMYYFLWERERRNYTNGNYNARIKLENIPKGNGITNYGHGTFTYSDISNNRTYTYYIRNSWKAGLLGVRNPNYWNEAAGSLGYRHKRILKAVNGVKDYIIKSNVDAGNNNGWVNNQWYRIIVECVGNWFKVEIYRLNADGSLGALEGRFTFTDNSFRYGTVGVMTISLPETRFRNLKLTRYHITTLDRYMGYYSISQKYNDSSKTLKFSNYTLAQLTGNLRYKYNNTNRHPAWPAGATLVKTEALGYYMSVSSPYTEITYTINNMHPTGNVYPTAWTTITGSYTYTENKTFSVTRKNQKINDTAFDGPSARFLQGSDGYLNTTIAGLFDAEVANMTATLKNKYGSDATVTYSFSSSITVSATSSTIRILKDSEVWTGASGSSSRSDIEANDTIFIYTTKGTIYRGVKRYKGEIFATEGSRLVGKLADIKLYNRYGQVYTGSAISWTTGKLGGGNFTATVVNGNVYVKSNEKVEKKVTATADGNRKPSWNVREELGIADGIEVIYKLEKVSGADGAYLYWSSQPGKKVTAGHPVWSYTDDVFIAECRNNKRTVTYSTYSEWYYGSINMTVDEIPYTEINGWKNGQPALGRRDFVAPITINLPADMTDTTFQVEIKAGSKDIVRQISYHFSNGLTTTKNRNDTCTFSFPVTEKITVEAAVYGAVTTAEKEMTIRGADQLVFTEKIANPNTDQQFLAVMDKIRSIDLVITSSNPNVEIISEPHRKKDDFPEAKLPFVEYIFKARIKNPTQTPWHPCIHSGHLYFNSTEYYLYADDKVKGVKVTKPLGTKFEFNYTVDTEGYMDVPATKEEYVAKDKFDFIQGTWQNVDFDTDPGVIQLSKNVDGSYISSGWWESPVISYTKPADSWIKPVVHGDPNGGEIRVLARVGEDDITSKPWVEPDKLTGGYTKVQYRIELISGTGKEVIPKTAVYNLNTVDKGEIVSDTIDLGANVENIKNITLTVTQPGVADGKYTVYTKTADTDTPEAWDDIVNPWVPVNGEGNVVSPVRRYLRYRIVLTPGLKTSTVTVTPSAGDDTVNLDNILTWQTLTADVIMPDIGGSISFETATAETLTDLASAEFKPVVDNVIISDPLPWLKFRAVTVPGRSFTYTTTTTQEDFTSGEHSNTYGSERLELLNNTYSGQYTSPVIDLGPNVEELGLILLDDVVNNDAITVKTRTSNDGATWSSWQDLVDGKIQSPPGRYLQYQIVMQPVIDPATTVITVKDSITVDMTAEVWSHESAPLYISNGVVAIHSIEPIADAIPEGSAIQIETATADAATGPWNFVPLNSDGTVASASGKYLKYRITVTRGDITEEVTVVPNQEEDTVTNLTLTENGYELTDLSQQGVYTSPVMDIGQVEGIKDYVYNITMPSVGGSVTIEWRSGNSIDEVLAAEWVQTDIPPVARYIQLRVTMTAGTNDDAEAPAPVSPTFNGMVITKITDANVLPDIKSINVYAEINNTPIVGAVTVEYDTYDIQEPVVNQVTITASAMVPVYPTVNTVTLEYETWQPKSTTPVVDSVVGGVQYNATTVPVQYSVAFNGAIPQDTKWHFITKKTLKEEVYQALSLNEVNIDAIRLTNFSIRPVNKVEFSWDFTGESRVTARSKEYHVLDNIVFLDPVVDENNECIVYPVPKYGAPVVVKDASGEPKQQVFFIDENGRPTLVNTEIHTGTGSHIINLAYADIDEATVEVEYKHDDLTDWVKINNWTLTGSVLELPFAVEPSSTVRVKYCLLNSFCVDYDFDRKRDYAKIKLHNPVLPEDRKIEVYYEVSIDNPYYTAKEVDLNPLRTGQTDGFIYIHTQDAVEPVAQLDIAVSAEELMANGYDRTVVTITAKDIYGNPVMGAPVDVYTTSGSIILDNNTTDSDGTVTAILVADTKPGTATVTASSGGITASRQVTFIGRDTGLKISLETDKNTLKIHEEDCLLLTIKCIDDNINNGAVYAVTVTTDYGWLSLAEEDPAGSNTITVKTAANGISRVYLHSTVLNTYDEVLELFGSKEELFCTVRASATTSNGITVTREVPVKLYGEYKLVETASQFVSGEVTNLNTDGSLTLIDVNNKGIYVSPTYHIPHLSKVIDTEVDYSTERVDRVTCKLSRDAVVFSTTWQSQANLTSWTKVEGADANGDVVTITTDSTSVTFTGNNGKDCFIYNPAHMSKQDYIISARVRINDMGDDDYVGLAFRIQDANNFYAVKWGNGTVNWYTSPVEKMRRIMLHKRVNGTFIKLYEGTAPDHFAWERYAYGKEYVLKLEVADNRFRFWINDIPVTDFIEDKDNTFTAGAWGPLVFSQTGVTFTDLKMIDGTRTAFTKQLTVYIPSYAKSKLTAVKLDSRTIQQIMDDTAFEQQYDLSRIRWIGNYRLTDNNIYTAHTFLAYNNYYSALDMTDDDNVYIYGYSINIPENMYRISGAASNSKDGPWTFTNIQTIKDKYFKYKLEILPRNFDYRGYPISVSKVTIRYAVE